MKHLDPSDGRYPYLDEEKLSPVAKKAVSRVLEVWDCNGDEAARLVGVDQAIWHSIAGGEYHSRLSQEQLLRASHLIGIYRGLQVFSEDVARRWPKLPNSGPLFKGKTPVEFMLEGGYVAIEQTRQYADSFGF